MVGRQGTWMHSRTIYANLRQRRARQQRRFTARRAEIVYRLAQAHPPLELIEPDALAMHFRVRFELRLSRHLKIPNAICTPLPPHALRAIVARRRARIALRRTVKSFHRIFLSFVVLLWTVLPPSVQPTVCALCLFRWLPGLDFDTATLLFHSFNRYSKPGGMAVDTYAMIVLRQ